MKLSLIVLVFFVVACSTGRRVPSNDLSNSTSVRQMIESDRLVFQQRGLNDSLRAIDSIRRLSERKLSQMTLLQLRKKHALKKVIAGLRMIGEDTNNLFALQIIVLQKEWDSASEDERSFCAPKAKEHIHLGTTCLEMIRMRNRLASQFIDSRADYLESMASEYRNLASEILAFLATTNAPGYPKSFITARQEQSLVEQVIDLQARSRDHHKRALKNKSLCRKTCFLLHEGK